MTTTAQQFIDRLIIVFMLLTFTFPIGMEGVAWAVRRSRRKASPPLLQIPSAHPPPKVFRTGLVVAALYALLVVVGWAFGAEVRPVMIVMALSFPTLAFLQYRQQMILHSQPRLEIREDGIMWGGGLLPWGRIRTYELRETKTQDRLLVLKGRQEFIGSIEVPHEYAEEVERLVREYVGEPVAANV